MPIKGTPVATPVKPGGLRGMMKGRMGSILGYGLGALGTYSYMQEGDSLPVAVGKSLAENALWASIGWVPAMGLMAASAAPDAIHAVEMARGNYSKKQKMFSHDYAQNEAQQTMMQNSYNNMMAARQSNAARMANHARGARKTYS